MLDYDNSLVASDVRITGVPCHVNENLSLIFEKTCGTLDISVPLTWRFLG